MNKNKVVASKNLPTRLPTISTLVIWLVLDRVHAPEWLWGAQGILVALTWVAAVDMRFWGEQPEEVFKESSPTS